MPKSFFKFGTATETTMTKRYTFWLTIAAILQLLSACAHALSFFIKHIPKNETEKQLYDLLGSYKPDLGPHFQPSFGDIYTGLSAAFTLLYLLGGWIILYLLSKNIPQETMKGVTGVCTLIFGANFLITLLFGFLPPIIMTGLVFLSLSFAYATNHIHFIKLRES